MPCSRDRASTDRLGPEGEVRLEDGLIIDVSSACLLSAVTLGRYRIDGKVASGRHMSPWDRASLSRAGLEGDRDFGLSISVPDTRTLVSDMHRPRAAYSASICREGQACRIVETGDRTSVAMPKSRRHSMALIRPADARDRPLPSNDPNNFSRPKGPII